MTDAITQINTVRAIQITHSTIATPTSSMTIEKTLRGLNRMYRSLSDRVDPAEVAIAGSCHPPRRQVLAARSARYSGCSVSQSDSRRMDNSFCLLMNL